MHRWHEEGLIGGEDLFDTHHDADPPFLSVQHALQKYRKVGMFFLNVCLCAYAIHICVYAHVCVFLSMSEWCACQKGEENVCVCVCACVSHHAQSAYLVIVGRINEGEFVRVQGLPLVEAYQAPYDSLDDFITMYRAYAPEDLCREYTTEICKGLGTLPACLKLLFVCGFCVLHGGREGDSIHRLLSTPPCGIECWSFLWCW